MKRIIEKLGITDSVVNVKYMVRAGCGRSKTNITSVRESAAESPEKSNR